MTHPNPRAPRRYSPFVPSNLARTAGLRRDAYQTTWVGWPVRPRSILRACRSGFSRMRRGRRSHCRSLKERRSGACHAPLASPRRLRATPCCSRRGVGGTGLTGGKAVDEVETGRESSRNSEWASE
jgi:hypothetical protein